MYRKDREVTNIDEILKIVGKAKILHLGLFDAKFPYIVPLHFGYEYADENLIFYIHCAKVGHKLDLIRQNSNVCVELECDIELIEGGDDPCMYSSTFASIIGTGKAEIAADENEKIKGLKLLMQNQTGRDFEITAQMAASVEIIRVIVNSFTAKAKQMPKGKRSAL
ncbi:MAG: pyridoxamine 5'-phosphate oxidase family protein [Clostridia bacterium]|nr:pyridoxamine 5'-phosphate oxidase family protein [Clostridia bacterium]